MGRSDGFAIERFAQGFLDKLGMTERPGG